jgi:hypothetical protein
MFECVDMCNALGILPIVDMRLSETTDDMGDLVDWLYGDVATVWGVQDSLCIQHVLVRSRIIMKEYLIFYMYIMKEYLIFYMYILKEYLIFYMYIMKEYLIFYMYILKEYCCNEAATLYDPTCAQMFFYIGNHSSVQI